MKSIVLMLTAFILCPPLFAEDIYESNLLGMKLKRINSISESETEFALVIMHEDGEETRRLLREGELYSVTRLQTEGSRVTETTDKNGSIETVIREGGIIVTENLQDSDGSEKRTEYGYENGRLEFADYFIDGEKLYRDRYFYTGDGRLLDVKRVFENGDSNMLISFVFNQGRISRYWFSGGNQQNYIRFDKNGIVFSDLSSGDNFRETRIYSLSSDGNRIEEIKNVKTGITTLLYYDVDQRLVNSIQTNSDGKKLQEINWKYSNGLLAEMKIKSELSLEIFEYEYSADEKLKKEVYLKNGVIIQTAEYEDDQNYTEILYRKDKPELKIEYRNGIRVDTVELQE